MTCMDFNLYLCGVVTALTVSTVFWYLMWCKAIAQRNEMMDLVQQYAEALIEEVDKNDNRK